MLEKTLSKEELSQKYVYMRDTLQEAYEVMHIQDKNIQGTVFGGYIMKNAFELAYLCVRLFSGDKNPTLKNIDLINFIKPVNIGQILKFSCEVTYCDPKKGLVRVRVQAKGLKVKMDESASELTNELHMTFHAQPDEPLKLIMPKTYKQSLLYLRN